MPVWTWSHFIIRNPCPSTCFFFFSVNCYFPKHCRCLFLLPLTHFHSTLYVLVSFLQPLVCLLESLCFKEGRAYILKTQLSHLPSDYWYTVLCLSPRHFIFHLLPCGCHIFHTQEHRGQAERRKSGTSPLISRGYFQINSINICCMLDTLQILGAMEWGEQEE